MIDDLHCRLSSNQNAHASQLVYDTILLRIDITCFQFRKPFVDLLIDL